MPTTSQLVQVGKRRVELSNLHKVLFPGDGISKAELIAYYLKVAPTLLKHISGRPLSFVRFPDGIASEAFYQKNKPDRAPQWIQHVFLGGAQKVDYILATEEASLAWLANLACVEFHQLHSRTPHYDKPDYIVFDLDPPEGYRFARLAEIALQLRELIETLEYRAFVKTSGRKGLHIFVPIEPKWGFDDVFEAASAIAKPFVQSHQDTTLHLKKDARRGRVLIDIYRNRPGQTIASPYSVRGLPGAPVSMPLRWEQLSTIDDPTIFNIRTVYDELRRDGDAWEEMGAYATPLHTERRSLRARSELVETTKLMHVYAQKRRFDNTPEPTPAVASGEGNAFVIHRHHATRLHYDLRLEREGVLKSWAVPKGLPPRPGVKRLAVAVEDHPLDYLTFEGRIPVGEYGAGMMWGFALGKYELTKQHRDGFDFRLCSRELNGEYRLIHTRGNDWLLERLDTPQVDWLREPIEPMLADSVRLPPDSPDYMFEVKWDGIRALIALDEGKVTLRSRSKRDITRLFPELTAPEPFRATCAVFDAEIVCLDPEGKPVFEHVESRFQKSSEAAIARARAQQPVVCYIFDCLYLDGRPIVGEPLTRRRAWMADAIRQGAQYRVSEALSEGAGLFEAVRRLGLEGVMAKKADSPYLVGKRSAWWLKIKATQTAEYVIIGYTLGNGDLTSSFGALHLGRYRGSELKYTGKVGTGFNEQQRKALYQELKKSQPVTQSVQEKVPGRNIWVAPRLVCEVKFASITQHGKLREPVFLRLRRDLSPEQCKD